MARKDRARSIFSLERENAGARMTRAFTGFVVVLALMVGVYYLSLVTPTIVPPVPDTPTPTPIIALPPTPTPPPLLPTPTPTPTPLPTPIPTPIAFNDTPVPTPTQVVAVGPAPNCPNLAARISQPGQGATVIGIVQITGAAATENFDYYKFEFRDPATNEWVFVTRYDNAVPNGVLGAWNSDTVPPGTYDFRLVVVDKTGNFPEPCVVQLTVR